MDVSPNGNLFAAAHGTQVSLGQISSGQVQLQLTGHVADVTTVQFFSSNLVVLTGAADFQLKIWSVLNGSNPVTLRGHTSAITSTAIVAQGRNVLSSSNDGTIKLWNCGTSSIIANIHLDTPVNKILLVPLPSKYSPAAFETLDPLEVETADKLVLAAMEDGSVRGIHLGTKKEIFATSKSDNALTAVAYHNGVLVTGDKHGLVQLYVMDHGLEQPWLQWKRNGHTITCLVMKLDENGEQVMCVSAGDGSVYQTNALESMLKEKHVQVTTEFAGSELETVYDMKVLPSDPSSGFQRLMCAVRDGKIKMY
ncbi:hypothetical protein CU098_000064 [Rhizopus stolonifer]|uniref:Uncharacterized protein n=1 Tax=Rhizopus stolonifer TaxID=4846 RepID=A0A367IMS8_RHIST|nr:hypothetical protein CU098_000064 [Rhizopus stolonifer]